MPCTRATPRLRYRINTAWQLSIRLRPVICGLLLVALNAQAQQVEADAGPLISDTPAITADLPALLRVTLDGHPAVRNRSRLQEAASAQVDAARRQFFPTPSINYERVEAAENDSVYRGNSQIGVVRLQQSLWTGGRLRGGLARARAARQLADADLAAVNLQLALQVAELWAEVQAAQAVVTALEQSRDIHQRLLDMVQRRVSGGASAVADAELAKARLQLVESDLQGAAARRDSALERIRAISGNDAYSPQRAGSSDYPRSIAEAPVNVLLEPALLQSPFVVRARLQVEVAEADIRMARAATSPEVFIRAESQRGSFEANDDSTRNRLVLGVTSTLGAGLSSLSAIAEARARAEAAREEVRVQELAVTEQIRGDVVILRSARARQGSLQQSRQSASDVLASSERLFIAGRRPWQDIMNAARDLAQTDSQIADAAGSELAAGWRLTLVVHGLNAVLASAGSRPASDAGGG